MLPSRARELTLLLLILILQLLSSTTSAQSTSTRSSSATSSTSSSSPRASVHVVEVGSENDFTYHPNVISASLGDTITFRFWPSGHSVIRGVYTDSDECGSSGCNPCIPYELVHPNQKNKGFGSQNIETSVTWSPGNDSTVFNYTVADESPIWFYCNAPSSCAGRGMVGVINPGPGQSVDKQITSGTKTKLELAPGQAWPYKDVPAGALNTTTPSAPKTTQTVSHTHGLSGGAIAGIVVGAVVVLLLAAALCFFVGRSNTYRDVIKHGHSQGAPSQGGAPSQMGDVPGSYHQQQSPPMAQAWHDHRFSGQSAWTAMSPPVDAGTSTFVGYNRHTGAPEFAAEAEAPVGPAGPVDHKKPPAGHPAFANQSTQGTTYELPASSPAPTGTTAHSSPNPSNPR